MPAWADVELDEAGRFTVYGDGRMRLETDWESFRGDGTERDDRTRLRIRARLGALVKPTDWLQAGARLRTGNDDHQQSGHITIHDFDGNSTGASDINFDKWFVNVRWKTLSVWAGRNSLPWWKQNSLFWDDDVTPRGLGGTWSTSLGPGELTLNGGYYNLPVGMRDFTGEAGSGQLVYALDGDTAGLTLAGGVMDIEADATPGDRATRIMLQGNPLRDYTLWLAQAQVRFNALPRDFYLGADYLHNSQSYSANDPDEFTAFHRDDVDGYVLQAVYGDVEERGDWLAGVYYTRLEALSIHNSYAQDDWVRWGSSDQTAASNMRGPEFRFGVGLGYNMDLIFRLYLVRGINKELPTDVRNQTGKRFRIDWNISF